MIDLEFIQRAQSLYENIDNRKHVNDLNRKSANTEKGKVWKTRGWKVRNKRSKEQWLKLTNQEKKEFKLFYKNRPPGMEIDHIIPLSRGGTHKISNLQYITRQQNLEKGCKCSVI